MAGSRYYWDRNKWYSVK